jgi:chemotaxis protein CheD
VVYKTPEHLVKYIVNPGGRYAADKPVLIQTLLGSCVAACLYDPESGVAGLNHFLLAAPRYSRTMPLTHTDAGRYGIMAMELLINDMIHLGADRRRMMAKVFGGATVIGPGSATRDNFLCVHEVNQRFIREYLKTENIPIVSEDLGGERGRVVYFHTDTFKVMRRFIQSSALVKIEEKERTYWKTRVEKPEEGEVTLF